MTQETGTKRAEDAAPNQNPSRINLEQELARISTTDAVVLAVLTVSAYIVHYFFEYGYLSYFKIPAAFISFNLNEMVPALVFVVAAYLILVLLLRPLLAGLTRTIPAFLKGKLFFLLILLVVGLVGSYALGRTAAVTRTTFSFASTSPGCAIVYTTSEKYLCKPVDQDNAFENAFVIFYHQESQNIEFRTVDVGRLRPQSILSVR